MLEKFFTVLRFGITGSMGMAIDFGITWFCKEKLKWNKYLANSTGFVIAVINNYIINRIWTFKSTNPNWEVEFEKYFLFSLIGLLLNNSFVYLFHQKLKWNFYASKLAASALVFIWNFSSNYFLNFR